MPVLHHPEDVPLPPDLVDPPRLKLPWLRRLAKLINDIAYRSGRDNRDGRRGRATNGFVILIAAEFDNDCVVRSSRRLQIAGEAPHGIMCGERRSIDSLYRGQRRVHFPELQRSSPGTQIDRESSGRGRIGKPRKF